MRNDFLTETSSASFAANEAPVKKANRIWVHQPGSAESGTGFAIKQNAGVDSIAETRKLLDRAIALGLQTAKPNDRPPVFTPAQWVWQLAGAYNLTHSYPPLMEEAAQRFKKMSRQNLSQWATNKAREELGHDKLALLDIQSMGYNAKAVVEKLIPPSTAILVNYSTQSLQAPNPISIIGYTYTMERIATGIQDKHIHSVETHLSPGIHATRCLRAHSSLGADVKHVEETVELIAELVPEERLRIAIACYETSSLYFRSTGEDYISEEELQNVLKPLESNTHLQSQDEIYSLT
ncbi:hypothetical protein Riv7116_1651 [Rivularia sp. PCC 7116]|uniref:hypothetical protein n=1 Tax=Rivularia sp. PCC 7116 TaxID=373994 RepID=UPI00029F352E|nr:hypothetical protein [Rivularia sp. PCC 7116]AFY54202.1 hypothetical protein Riv7116_1651 [Rivularia sp. PCC 7116]